MSRLQDKDTVDKNLTTFDSKSSYKSLLLNRFERRKSQSNFDTKGSNTAQQSGSKLEQQLQQAELDNERSVVQAASEESHCAEELKFKLAHSDPSELSAIELKKSLNFLKNHYIDRTKQLNTIRAQEKAVLQTARSLLTKSQAATARDDKQRINDQQNGEKSNRSQTSNKIQTSRKMNIVESQYELSAMQTLNQNESSTLNNINRRASDSNPYVDTKIKKNDTIEPSQRSNESMSQNDRSIEFDQIKLQMRQIQSELTMQQQLQKEDQKKLEFLQKIVSPKTNIAQKVQNPLEERFDQLCLRQHVDTDSIKNIQTAYHQRMQQITSTTKYTLGDTANSLPQSNKTSKLFNQQLDTQVLPLCHVSPRTNQENIQEPPKPRELNGSSLAKLHKEINKSLFEKQDQLKKLKEHYQQQESLIEDQIKQLEQSLTVKKDDVAHARQDRHVMSHQIEVVEQPYQNTGKQQLNSCHEFRSIRSLNNTKQYDTTTYSYSLANSLSRRFKEQEIPQQFDRIINSELDSKHVDQNRQTQNCSFQTIPQIQDQNPNVMIQNEASTPQMEEIPEDNQDLILIENQLTQTKQHYQLTVPEIECVQQEEHHDSMHKIDPHQPSQIFSYRCQLNSRSSTQQSQQPIQFNLQRDEFQSGDARSIQIEHVNSDEINAREHLCSNEFNSRGHLCSDDFNARESQSQFQSEVIFQNENINMFHPNAISPSEKPIQTPKELPYSQKSISNTENQTPSSQSPYHHNIPDQQQQFYNNQHTIPSNVEVAPYFNDKRKSQSIDIFQMGALSSIRSSSEENCFTQRHQIYQGQIYQPNNQPITIGSHNIEQTSTPFSGEPLAFDQQREDDYISTFGRNYYKMVEIVSNRQNQTIHPDQFNYTKSLVSPTNSNQPPIQLASYDNSNQISRDTFYQQSFHRPQISNQVCPNHQCCHNNQQQVKYNQDLSQLTDQKDISQLKDQICKSVQTTGRLNQPQTYYQQEQTIKVNEVASQTSNCNLQIYTFSDQKQDNGTNPQDTIQAEINSLYYQNKRMNNSNYQGKPQQSTIENSTLTFSNQLMRNLQQNVNRQDIRAEQDLHFITPTNKQQQIQKQQMGVKHTRLISHYGQIKENEIEQQKFQQRQVKKTHNLTQKIGTHSQIADPSHPQSTLIFCSSNTLSPLSVNQASAKANPNSQSRQTSPITNLYQAPRQSTITPRHHQTPPVLVQLNSYIPHDLPAEAILNSRQSAPVGPSTNSEDRNFVEQTKRIDKIIKDHEQMQKIRDNIERDNREKKMEREVIRSGGTSAIRDASGSRDEKPKRETSEMVRRLREAIQKQEQVKRMLQNQRNYKQLYFNIWNIEKKENEIKLMRRESKDKKRGKKSSKERSFQSMSKSRSEISLNKCNKSQRSTKNFNFSTFGKQGSTPRKTTQLQQSQYSYQVNDYNDQAINLSIPGPQKVHLNKKIPSRPISKVGQVHIFDSQNKIKLETDSSIQRTNCSQPKERKNDQSMTNLNLLRQTMNKSEIRQSQQSIKFRNNANSSHSRSDRKSILKNQSQSPSSNTNKIPKQIYTRLSQDAPPHEAPPLALTPKQLRALSKSITRHLQQQLLLQRPGTSLRSRSRSKTRQTGNPTDIALDIDTIPVRETKGSRGRKEKLVNANKSVIVQKKSDMGKRSRSRSKKEELSKEQFKLNLMKKMDGLMKTIAEL